ESAARSRPSKRMLPDSIRPVPGSRPRMDIAVTVLPDPDSPITPTVSPRPTSKLTSSTTRVTWPEGEVKPTLSFITVTSDPLASGAEYVARALETCLARGNIDADQVSTEASRTMSPSSPSASTVTAITTPGGQISQGCSTITLTPSANIPPQLGAGVGT